MGKMALVALVVVVLSAAPASATVIEFGDVNDRLVPSTDGQNDGGLDDTYGSAANQPEANVNDFNTPNVSVLWDRNDVTPGGRSDHWLQDWSTYFDGTGAATNNEAYPTDLPRTPDIIFTADAGYGVQLDSVKIYLGVVTNVAEELDVYVDNVLVTSLGPITNTNSPTTLANATLFNVDLSASGYAATHTLAFESNINMNRFRLDSVTFSQQAASTETLVPEPATVGLVCLGALALIRRR